jgi:hypothetical protein
VGANAPGRDRIDVDRAGLEELRRAVDAALAAANKP